MQQNLSTRWYSAYPTVAMILSILSGFSCLTTAFGAVFLQTSGPALAEWVGELVEREAGSSISALPRGFWASTLRDMLEQIFDISAGAMLYSLIAGLVIFTLLLASSILVKRGGRAALPVLYALNVATPVSALVSIPFISTAMNAFTGIFSDLFALQEVSISSSEIFIIEQSFAIAQTFAIWGVVFSALVSAGLLALNSFYFYKRRHLLCGGTAAL